MRCRAARRSEAHQPRRSASGRRAAQPPLSIFPRTTNVAAIPPRRSITSGLPTSPAWMMRSAPASAAIACGRSSPWVSEMTPRMISLAAMRSTPFSAAPRIAAQCNVIRCPCLLFPVGRDGVVALVPRGRGANPCFSSPRRPDSSSSRPCHPSSPTRPWADRSWSGRAHWRSDRRRRSPGRRAAKPARRTKVAVPARLQPKRASMPPR